MILANAKDLIQSRGINIKVTSLSLISFIPFIYLLYSLSNIYHFIHHYAMSYIKCHFISGSIGQNLVFGGDIT